ncbi:hypothetical protein AB1Y20_001906 [Prymnesium parvum]|uniref:Uncharacterized protein n=1 Tax=Prymnesium parvum TaxID=97485 RepID=A0AB34J9P4_PRYPA
MVPTQGRPAAHRMSSFLALEPPPAPPLPAPAAPPPAAPALHSLARVGPIDPSADYMELLLELWHAAQPPHPPLPSRSSQALWDAVRAELPLLSRATPPPAAAPAAAAPSAPRISEVAFFSSGCVSMWFFTARDGSLRRKSRAKANCAALLDSLASRGDRRAGGVLALALFQPEACAVTHAAPLDAAALAALLGASAPSAARRHSLRALLRYTKPRGEHDAVLRFDWREKICGWELRRAVAPLGGGGALWARLCTHGPAASCSARERFAPPRALDECRRVCRELAARRGGRRRVVADFRLLPRDGVELVWAVFPQPAEPPPLGQLPASMPCLPPRHDAPEEPREGGRHAVRALTLNASRFFVCPSCGKLEQLALSLQPKYLPDGKEEKPPTARARSAPHRPKPQGSRPAFTPLQLREIAAREKSQLIATRWKPTRFCSECAAKFPAPPLPADDDDVAPARPKPRPQTARPRMTSNPL